MRTILVCAVDKSLLFDAFSLVTATPSLLPSMHLLQMQIDNDGHSACRALVRRGREMRIYRSWPEAPVL